MGHKGVYYQLSSTIRVRCCASFWQKKDKRDRVSVGKNNVLIACESKDKKAGFIAMAVVDSICHFSVDKFVKEHLKLGQKFIQMH
jgi:hypothetical protein